MLLAVAVGVVYALQLFGVLSRDQVKPEWLVYACRGIVRADDRASCCRRSSTAAATPMHLGDIGISYGPSFGVFFALITTAALTYFTALAAQGAGAKLPFKVPGPA